MKSQEDRLLRVFLALGGFFVGGALVAGLWVESIHYLSPGSALDTAKAKAATIVYLGFLALIPALIRGARTRAARAFVGVVAVLVGGLAALILGTGWYTQARIESAYAESNQLEEDCRNRARGLELPFNPFEKAAPGDWTEVLLSSRFDDGAGEALVRYEVATVEGDSVTVAVTARSRATGVVDSSTLSFSRKVLPRVADLFPERPLASVLRVETRSTPVTIGGRELACVELSFFERWLPTPEILVMSKDVKGIGVVARHRTIRQSDELALMGYGSREGPIWRRDPAAAADTLPWNPLENAVVGDWSAYVWHWEGAAGDGAVVRYEVQAVDAAEVTLARKCARPPRGVEAEDTWKVSRHEPLTWRALMHRQEEVLTDRSDPAVEDVTFAVGGKPFACRKVSFEPRRENPYTVWLSKDVKCLGVAATTNARGWTAPNFELVGYGSKDAVAWGRRPD